MVQSLPFLLVLYGRVRFQGLGRERLRVSADGCSYTVGFSFFQLRYLMCDFPFRLWL